MKYVPIYLDFLSTKALRRVIARNLPAAPEKDKPLLDAIYTQIEKAEKQHVKNLRATGDLFDESEG